MSKYDDTNGYIYICGDRSPFLKIGVSQSFPNKRIRDLSTKHHTDFVLLAYAWTANYQQKERDIHAHFVRFRVGGEWFDISFEDFAYYCEEENIALRKYMEPVTEVRTVTFGCENVRNVFNTAFPGYLAVPPGAGGQRSPVDDLQTTQSFLRQIDYQPRTRSASRGELYWGQECQHLWSLFIVDHRFPVLELPSPERFHPQLPIFFWEIGQKRRQEEERERVQLATVQQ